MTDAREKFENNVAKRHGLPILKLGGVGQYYDSGTHMAWVSYQEATESMTAENTRLREALRFYADNADTGFEAVLDDKGSVAKKALAGDGEK